MLVGQLKVDLNAVDEEEDTAHLVVWKTCLRIGTSTRARDRI